MDNWVEWLNTPNATIGMTPAGVVTTTFAAFCLAFVVSIFWPKALADFRSAGGCLAAGLIVGTFWILNHMLPGWGMVPPIRGVGNIRMQYGLIQQAHNGAGPWIDMGFAAGFGLWMGCVFRGDRWLKAVPRLIAVIVGGLLGGAMAGLMGMRVP